MSQEASFLDNASRNYNRRFIHLYSKVPYLDRQIFHAEVQGLNSIKKHEKNKAYIADSLKNTEEMSIHLAHSLDAQKIQTLQQEEEFLEKLQRSICKADKDVRNYQYNSPIRPSLEQKMLHSTQERSQPRPFLI